MKKLGLLVSDSNKMNLGSDYKKKKKKEKK